MKSVLSWLKSNVLLVILAILTVVPLPVAWFVATGMNSSLVEGREKAAQDALRKVQGASVTYQLEPLTPDQEAISESSAPNAAKTAYFKAEQDRRLAQVGLVKSAATEYNRNGREPLVSGLFPEPAPAQSQLKRNEMARRAVAADTPESAYNALFRRLRIRPPVDGVDLASRIQTQRDRQVREVTGDQGESALKPEDRERIDAQMLDLRISRYRTHARDVAFYGSMDILPLNVQRVTPGAPPPVEVCFAWQFDYWLIEDVLKALNAANASLDASGNGGNAIDGVVKRIESLVIDQPAFVAGGGQADPRQPRGGQDEGGAGASTITGRGASQSDLYDLRTATVSLVVSSEKLPVLLDEISKSNFFTVIDIDLFEVDPWNELEGGYYYGSDAVVRAEITLEALLLREWTVPFMPEAIKSAMGIASETDQEG